jgi:hypothetical protein
LQLIANMTLQRDPAARMPKISLAPVPLLFAAYRDDPFLNAVEFGFPLLLMLSLLYTSLSIVRVRYSSFVYLSLSNQSIVYEKEKRLKESMKMMGVSNFIQWLVGPFVLPLPAPNAIAVMVHAVFLVPHGLPYMLRHAFVIVSVDPDGYHHHHAQG